MSIICRVFGHKHNKWHYGKVVRSGIDGIGREHAYLKKECLRCGEQVTVSYLHLIPREKEKRVRERLEEAEKLLQSGYGEGI